MNAREGLAEESDTRVYTWSLNGYDVHPSANRTEGAPKSVRRLLTGYAVSFNRWHSWHGYLFQDRYKSVVSSEVSRGLDVGGCALRCLVVANFFRDDTRLRDKRSITTEAFSEALSLRN